MGMTHLAFATHIITAADAQRNGRIQLADNRLLTQSPAAA
jgi:hypothetical protein